MTIPNNPAPNEEWTNDATGITYTWNGERWLIKPGEASGDFVPQDVFEADQKRQDDDIEAGFDTQGSILIKNIEQDQTLGVHSGQINALETQVQLLAGVRAVGRWTYRRRVESNSPRPPADSCFYGTHKDDISTILRNWSDINLLMINKTDLDGNTFAFSQFEEGDKVEVIASDGSSAVYGTVTNNPSNDVYANMILAVERSNGGPVEEKEYLISAYRPGSSNGEVDLDILDGRYLIRTGDDMNQDTYLSFPGGGVKFYGSNDPKKSVIYSASDTVSQWTAYNGTSIKLTARDGAPGNGRTYIDIKTADSNGTEGADDGYRMKLFHLAEPTEPAHAATKAYVDNSAGAANKPANWQWKWVGNEDYDPTNLNPGEFCGPQSSTDSSGSIYYFSTKPYNSPNKIILDRTYLKSMEFSQNSGGPLFSQWYQGGDSGTGQEDTRDPNWYLQGVARTKKLTFYPYDNINADLSGQFFSVELHSGGGYNASFYNVAKYSNRLYYCSLAGVF